MPGAAPDGQGATPVVSVNSYDRCVAPSLNANSGNGGVYVDWFNSGPRSPTDWAFGERRSARCTARFHPKAREARLRRVRV